MSSATFRVLWTSEDLGIAQIGPVCLVVWHGAVTQPLFDRQQAALKAVVAQHPGDAGFMCVVGSSSPPPDSRLRQASLDMITRHGDRLAWVICVIEGDGLHAATTRSVLSGMSLLLRGTKPSLTFTSDVQSAVTMVASHFDATSAARLSEAHAHLLAAMSGGASP
jgi:hypothetical protein